jgi:hypothetical protein
VPEPGHEFFWTQGEHQRHQRQDQEQRETAAEDGQQATLEYEL